jgi:catechol 2,3-dioxygenase-like lactoylglutathione lyase family enzyme
MRLNQVTVGCRDIDASVAFYKRLGLRQIVADKHYARFELPDGGSTFSLHVLDGAPDPGQTCVYFECDDLDAVVARLKGEGFAFESGPVDQPWLWREAWLRDPYGNRVCLYFAGANRLDPPWRLREST